jgi:cytochrome c biogenesis protein CcdA
MSDLFNPIAFTAGMVALVNPCGFALLPAYLGYFLGMNDGKTDSRLQALNRSQLVAGALSLGFLAVFGALGILFTGLRSQLTPILPWFSMAVGIALVFLGFAMLAGFKPMVSIPKMEKGTGGGSMFNMFLFGISYAVASLSCTIGVFLAVVGTSVPGASFTSQLGGFVSYGAGMGLLATILTLAVGFGKKNIVMNFKKLLPKINFISGLILIPVGVYVFLYGIWDRQVLETRPDEWTPWLNDFMRGALDIQTDISNFIGDRSTALGWIFLAVNVVIIALGFAERRLRKTPKLDTRGI